MISQAFITFVGFLAVASISYVTGIRVASLEPPPDPPECPYEVSKTSRNGKGEPIVYTPSNSRYNAMYDSTGQWIGIFDKELGEGAFFFGHDPTKK